MDFATTRAAGHTHSVADAQVRYSVDAGKASGQAIADAFLAGYHIEPGQDDGEPVRFTVERIAGGHPVSLVFIGRPNGAAQWTGEV